MLYVLACISALYFSYVLYVSLRMLYLPIYKICTLLLVCAVTYLGRTLPLARRLRHMGPKIH